MSYQLPPYVFLMRKLPVPPYDFSVNFRCMCKVFFVFEGEVMIISQSFAQFLAMKIEKWSRSLKLQTCKDHARK